MGTQVFAVLLFEVFCMVEILHTNYLNNKSSALTSDRPAVFEFSFWHLPAAVDETLELSS